MKRDNRKSYIESEKHQKTYALKMITIFFTWLIKSFDESFLKKYKLKVSTIGLVDHNDAVEKIKIDVSSSNPTQSKRMQLKHNLEIYSNKERNNVSDKCYQSFINAGANFPSLIFVKMCRRTLDNQVISKKNLHGSYYDPKEKIGYYLNMFRDEIQFKNDIVNIRLAGDGTNIARNFTILNLTFGFLDPINQNNISNPNTASGNFILGNFHIKKECYQELKTALAELIEILENLTEITISGKTYKIEFYLSSDMKFLALALGINGANSEHPCILCDLRKVDFSKILANII